ncbi:hypothetical protein RQM65_08140 [Pricia sp. S334]|uniref:Membrane or secreted protein n=1 Tax=Pricia mediterranea TaxID=3076079 RepID=A0ABU3L5K6_9FLAO|nr:hypothetical protein [Pricia sp. S334]MDT7828631.1 hypothetical protein [Pricia sp. S334]
MNFRKFFAHAVAGLLLGSSTALTAQIEPGVYISNEDGVRHELKIGKDYFIHSAYGTSPPKFIKTVGGFHTLGDDLLKVDLEFNSNHDENGLTELAIPILVKNKKLVLPMDGELEFVKQEPVNQALDGAWLFATRGPDKGQERRGDENPRKTLKWLQDGRFQWIAYNTDTREFFGTGGGSYTSDNGKYVENIDYFSRDDSRVGATLDFDYELKNGDWHHSGKNSKGEPLYEIWAPRK